MSVMERLSLKGKTAVVTGGANGMGKAVSEVFAEFGANVVIFDKNGLAAEEQAKRLHTYGVGAFAVELDVTQEAAVKKAFTQVHKAFGRIDIVYNNVGLSLNCPAEKMDYADFRRIIELDLCACFLVAKEAGCYMIRQGGGSLINTASMSGHIINIPQCQCGYNSAKAGVIQLTKSLAVEWAKYNVRVNCISPGYMDTPMVARAPEERREIWRSMTPMKRMGSAEEVQGAALYLASEAASFTTGSDIVIDGGFTCI